MDARGKVSAESARSGDLVAFGAKRAAAKCCILSFIGVFLLLLTVIGLFSSIKLCYSLALVFLCHMALSSTGMEISGINIRTWNFFQIAQPYSHSVNDELQQTPCDTGSGLRNWGSAFADHWEDPETFPFLAKDVLHKFGISLKCLPQD